MKLSPNNYFVNESIKHKSRTVMQMKHHISQVSSPISGWTTIKNNNKMMGGE
jgi:hypothetical protein